MPAFAAGHGDFAYVAGQLQIGSALGAAEIFIFLPVFEAVHCLSSAAAHIGGLFKIQPVLGGALFNVAGEHSEKCPDIQRKAQIAQQADTGDYSEDV